MSRAVASMPPRTESPAPPASLAVVGAITFLNSLGSGLLWSGIFFVTEQSLGWGPRANFLLALGATVVYAACAFLCGAIVSRLSRRISTRGVVALLMTMQLVGGAVAPIGAIGLVFCALLASAAGAILWPIMEGYLSAGRHGHGLRHSIGAFNLVWMSATFTALLLMAPAIASGHAVTAMLLFVPVSGVSLLLLPRLPRHPPPHGPESEHRHRPDGERALRDATRVLLPVGYILIGSLGPTIPFLLGEIQVDPGLRTPVTAVWMVARLVTVMALMRLAFWHGRPGALVLGFVLAAGGFAVIAMANSLEVMLGGLVLFGIGQAIIYFAALYYAMAVGGAEIGAGGVFEGLIGLGYGVGPIIGLSVGSGTEYVWGVLLVSVAVTAIAFGRMAAARRARRRRGDAAPRSP